VNDLIEDNKDFNLIWADQSDTVASVLSKLAENRISSLPVKDSNGKFIGAIDVLDLVTFCYTKFAKISEMAWESEQQMTEFNNKKIKDLINISGRNFWHKIQYNKPLDELLSILSNSNIHRVFVVNEVDDIIGLVSQSSILNFIHSHPLQPSLQQLYNEPVTKWIKSGTNPLTINMREFVIKAYEQIWDKQVTGMAVVDDDGKLVGNISASNLKKAQLVPLGLLAKDLYQPLKTWLHIRGDLNDRVLMADLPKNEPIAVNMDSKFGEIVKILSEKKIHRVYVIDEDKKPLCVITYRDLLARVLERVHL